MKRSCGPTKSTPDYFPIVEQLVHRCAVGVTPILGNNWRIPKWEGVGTGFVLMDKGNAYLVTANHVLDGAVQYKQVVAKIFGEPVHLHGLYFASDPTLDVSVTLLPKNWLNSYGIDEIFAPSAIELHPSYEGTGQYVILWFPASMNKIDCRWPSDSPKAAWFTALRAAPNIVRTTIPSPLCLTYDPKDFRDGGRNPPALQGMSGGPVWEIISRRITDLTTGLSLYPQGVLCEWHKGQKTIVASTIGSVTKTIHARSNVLKLTKGSHARPFSTFLR